MEFIHHIFEKLDTEISEEYILINPEDKSIQEEHITNAYCRNSWLSFIRENRFSEVKKSLYHMIVSTRTCVKCKYR